jgi:hypothetical protein
MKVFQNVPASVGIILTNGKGLILEAGEENILEMFLSIRSKNLTSRSFSKTTKIRINETTLPLSPVGVKK